jgi:hypothetical protein
MEDVVEGAFQLGPLGNVVLDESELRVTQQVGDVVLRPCRKII